MRDAERLPLTGAVRLLTPFERGSEQERDRAARRRLDGLRAGRLKRWVFAVDTAAGPRIIKISQPRGWLRGFSGAVLGSQAAAEHARHRRAQALGLAEVESRGWLELRSGLRLIRACQVQMPVAAGREDLDRLLANELGAHGAAAAERLGEALAAMHALPFFHADVKGYHAYPVDVRHQHGAASYRLRWIDLGRVSFWMSPRKRVINLYQALRFLLPRDDELQHRLVASYCEAARWGRPEHVLATVRRFLTRKLLTQPPPG